MYKTDLELLPQEYSNKAFPLEASGLSSLAFDISTCLELMPVLKARHCVVLGGDLYRLGANGALEMMSEGWAFQPSGNLEDSDDGIETATAYLSRALKWAGPNVLVDIVLQPSSRG